MGKNTTEVVDLFADCLIELYAIAGLPIPAEVDPLIEARNIANKIRRDTLQEAASIVGGIPTEYPLPVEP